VWHDIVLAPRRVTIWMSSHGIKRQSMHMQHTTLTHPKHANNNDSRFLSGYFQKGMRHTYYDGCAETSLRQNGALLI
jgi:hypothetical protein